MSGIQRFDRTSFSMWPSEDGRYMRYDDHAAEISRLRAEADALRVDAMRYRWLRKFTDQSAQAIEHLPCSDGDLIDDAIDAAMGADA